MVCYMHIKTCKILLIKLLSYKYATFGILIYHFWNTILKKAIPNLLSELRNGFLLLISFQCSYPIHFTYAKS